MAAHKFHIGPDGPAPCRARFRACKYEISGNSLEELSLIWEKQQEALFENSLAGVSKSPIVEETAVGITPETFKLSEVSDFKDANRIQASKILSERERYEPSIGMAVYWEGDQEIARKLALSNSNLTKFAYTPIAERDTFWQSIGCSSVERYILEDGSVGYFKPLDKNSNREEVFHDYGTSSLGAAINEVNSYRMAKALGGKYAELVPETVIREINGSIGSFQRQVDWSISPVNYEETPSLKEDVRRAAIFDFVIGNLDRHGDNFLYGEPSEDSDSNHCIRLIDNAFSFPKWNAKMNMSIFTENEAEYTMTSVERILTKDDAECLGNARRSVQDWINAGTIDESLGKSAVERIDFLLEKREVSSFFAYQHDR